MADDKNKSGPEDTSRVNIHERYEVEYWSKRFGVTPERLREAVEKAGTSVTAVAAELRRR